MHSGDFFPLGAKISTSMMKIPSKNSDPLEYPIHELIQKRWSPRAFSPKIPTDKEVNSLFEAMRWAASSMNEQPWNIFYGFKGEENFQRIGETLFDGNKKWALNAPVLLLTVVKNAFENGQPNSSAKHDLGLAIGNLSIQATSLGIGLHQMGGFDKEKASALLNIPTNYYEPVSVIAIGYFGDPQLLDDSLKQRELSTRTRKKVAEFTFRGKFQDNV